MPWPLPFVMPIIPWGRELPAEKVYKFAGMGYRLPTGGLFDVIYSPHFFSL